MTTVQIYKPPLSQALAEPHGVSLPEAFWVWLRVALLSFGGPAGQVLNLSVWFAIHTLFREAVPIHVFPFWFDAPRPTSIDLWALALSVAAAVAIFRFQVGMIPTLVACSIAGMLLHFMGVLS